MTKRVQAYRCPTYNSKAYSITEGEYKSRTIYDNDNEMLAKDIELHISCVQLWMDVLYIPYILYYIYTPYTEYIDL